MLTGAQREFFADNGYLVIEDVLDRETVLDPIRREYADILDRLYDGWWREGRVAAAPDGLTFEEKLITAYRAGCDWFQPMDISLPGDRIQADTPMHFGPAVFGLVTSPRLLDLVEDLIGPEITSNPIQHVRIKPPATDLRADEIRAHITSTDWHQDQGVTHAEADNTKMVTVWCDTGKRLPSGHPRRPPGRAEAPLPAGADGNRRTVPRYRTRRAAAGEGGGRRRLRPLCAARLAGQSHTGHSLVVRFAL